MEPINYTVLRIDGDYAVLTTGKGDENPVAMALLPPGITEGDHLICELPSCRLIQRNSCSLPRFPMCSTTPRCRSTRSTA